MVAPFIVVTALVLFILRRARGWSSWRHLGEVATYFAALGVAAGVAQESLAKAFGYGMWTGAGLTLLYWLAYTPRAPSEDRGLAMKRSLTEQKRRRFRILQWVAGVSALGAVVTFVLLGLTAPRLLATGVGLWAVPTSVSLVLALMKLENAGPRR
jgi:hypothetical protein